MTTKHLVRLIKRLVAVRDARAKVYNSKEDRPRLQSDDDDLWQKWNEANNRCEVAFKKLWKRFDEENDAKDANEKELRTTGYNNEKQQRDTTKIFDGIEKATICPDHGDNVRPWMCQCAKEANNLLKKQVEVLLQRIVQEGNGGFYININTLRKWSIEKAKEST